MSSYQYSFARTAEPPSGRGAPRLSYLSKAQYSQEWNSNLHAHGCAEMFFITDGHGRFRTQYEEFPVSIHDLIVVNANVLHTELSQLDSPLEYIVLGVEGLEAMGGAGGYLMLHLHSGWRDWGAGGHGRGQGLHHAPPPQRLEGAEELPGFDASGGSGGTARL